MAVKTNFSDSELITILADYNIGQYLGSEPIVKGTIQTNYIISTSMGRFVFRFYENRSKESVLFETNLINYLKKRDYPCQTVVANKHGHYVGIYRGRPYCFFEFIEGKHAQDPSEEQKKQLIRKVAELQNITKKYRPSKMIYRGNYTPELCKQLAQDKADKLNNPTATNKLSWIQDKIAELVIPRSLPKGICHCDFHFSNVLFNNDQFKALIDFDDANYTYLTFDLVGLIESNAWAHTRNEVLDFDEASRTVAEYTQYRPLNNIEKRHLFDVYKLSILFDSIWFMERGNADDFRERRKIGFLDRTGPASFYAQIFH